MADETTQVVANEWVSFPGGELEGQRPRVRCAACRARQRGDATLCFQCYRANLDRERALRAAGALDTASTARFQQQLPFEPVDAGRLALLKTERAHTRGTLVPGTLVQGTLVQGADRFAERRRRAQMAARRALQAIVAARPSRASAAYDRTIAAALHAAELQLPDSWMPFVSAR